MLLFSWEIEWQRYSVTPGFQPKIPANAPASVRRRYTTLVNQAEDVCFSCPLTEGCLYQASSSTTWPDTSPARPRPTAAG